MRLRDAALQYARRGLRVLPIRERAKEPLVQHGVHDASTDEATIRAWWGRWPAANVAIAVPAEWVVVDVDPRNGGDLELARLRERYGQLPSTVTARTGSGGEHLLFARPDGLRLRGKLGRGVDLLGTGRYVLVAPSIHPCGGRYVWTSPRGKAIAQPPAWLIDLAKQPEPPPPALPAPAPTFATTAMVDRARKYLAACPGAIAGSGGHAHTFLVAQKLTRGFGLSEAEAFALLVHWNRTTCKPPWPKRDLARKVAEAARVGRMPVGALADKPFERRLA